VLTRLPAPHRAPAEVVREFLETRFGEPWLRMEPEAYRAFVLGLPAAAISGGAAYDALIAATAVQCGARLLSCDRRALPVYQRYGAQVELL